MQIPGNAHFVVEWDCPACGGSGLRHSEEQHCLHCGRVYSHQELAALPLTMNQLPCGHERRWLVDEDYCDMCGGKTVVRRTITLADLAIVLETMPAV